MADTTFVSKSTPAVSLSWLQDLNDLFYRGTKSLTVTTLTATTKVVTANVLSPAATNLTFSVTGIGNAYEITTGLHLRPVSDNTVNLGDASHRVVNVFVSNIDSGIAGPLSFKTNNGTAQVIVDHIANAVNTINLAGGATGNAVTIDSRGTDANPGLDLRTKGSGTIGFRTDVLTTNVIQLQVIHTASASRNITITGSNGGNPIISTTAGDIRVGGAVNLRMTNAQGLIGRNNADSLDINMISTNIVDQVVLGTSTNDIKWSKTNMALGGGAAPTFGTIGGTGPAAAAQRNWLRFVESDGTFSYIPVWR